MSTCGPCLQPIGKLFGVASLKYLIVTEVNKFKSFTGEDSKLSELCAICSGINAFQKCVVTKKLFENRRQVSDCLYFSNIKWLVKENLG